MLTLMYKFQELSSGLFKLPQSSIAYSDTKLSWHTAQDTALNFCTTEKSNSIHILLENLV